MANMTRQERKAATSKDKTNFDGLAQWEKCISQTYMDY